jgi:hypothetical protein
MCKLFDFGGCYTRRSSIVPRAAVTVVKCHSASLQTLRFVPITQPIPVLQNCPKYRVIQKSLRDVRPLRYSSRDGHAEREHVNRGRDTPSFCPTLQVLDMSFLLCLSWFLRSRVRKFRIDLWITLYYDLCAVHLVRFIIQTNKCTILYIYIYI